MSNVELLPRWIPGPALDPDPGSAGMTVDTSLTSGARPDATNDLITDTSLFRFPLRSLRLE